jgi:hypothetical protein
MAWPDTVVDRARSMRASGMRHKAIARALGVPLNTVWGWLCRGKRRVLTEGNKALMAALAQDAKGTLHAAIKVDEDRLADAVAADVLSGTSERSGAVLIQLLKESIK